MSSDQPLKPPAVSFEGAPEKRQFVKRTVETGPVFAAALERLNRRSMIALIEEVMEQINEHCEKIGIAMEQNVSIKIAYAKLEQHLHDLHVTNELCITEINSIRQEISSLHAHIPCISVIEKIEELNTKINDMSEKNPPMPQRQSKTAWCSSCLCAAAFVLAAAALAWLLHTQYHQNAQQQTLLYQQITDRLTAFESRLKQIEERQANQSTQTAVIQQKIEVNAQAIAKLDQCRATQAPAEAADTAQQNPEDEPLPPSTVTLVTLETNMNLLAVLFRQQITSYEQAIIKLEKCCAAPPPVPIEPKKPDEPKSDVVIVPPAPTPKPDPAPITPIINPNQDIIVLSGVNFDTATSNLTESAKKILTDVAATLKRALPNQRFEVAGHTDNRGNAKMNQRLSQDRAEAVRKFLIAQGIRQELLTSKGYGPSKPVADNATPEGQAKNRRVELDKQ